MFHRSNFTQSGFSTIKFNKNIKSTRENTKPNKVPISPSTTISPSRVPISPSTTISPSRAPISPSPSRYSISPSTPVKPSNFPQKPQNFPSENTLRTPVYPESGNCCPSFKDAVSNIHLVCLKNLLQRTGSEQGYSPIHIATVFNSPEVIKKLILEGADPNEPSHLGVTPIHLACQKGHLEGLITLLRCGASPNVKDSRNFGVLHYAAQADPPLESTKVIVVLAKFYDNFKDKYGQLKLDEVSVDGLTPLHLATENNAKAVASALIQLGADINLPYLSNGLTSLHMAAHLGYLDIMKLLLKEKSKIKVNALDAELQTPMHLACLKQNLECIKLLSENGADIDREDEFGRTPLHFALQENFIEGVEFLLSKKAFIEHCNKEGLRPIHFAAASSLELVAVLIKAGAKVNVETETGITPLIMAIQNQKPDIVEYLVKHSANPNTWDHSGANPLHYAALLGDNESVEVLLKAGVDKNATNVNNETPLLLAMMKSQYHVALQLLRSGANIECQNLDGIRPIHLLAMEEGDNVELMQRFLAKGVNPRVRTSEGITPLMMATEAGNERIAQLLMKHGVRE